MTYNMVNFNSLYSNSLLNFVILNNLIIYNLVLHDFLHILKSFLKSLYLDILNYIIIKVMVFKQFLNNCLFIKIMFMLKFPIHFKKSYLVNRILVMELFR